MSLLHKHDHGAHEHQHYSAPFPDPHNRISAPERGIGRWFRHRVRFIVATLIVVGAAAAACLVLVSPGEAVVITRFGDPVRVIARPGLALRLPAPIESTINVDIRLRTTSTGLQDVGARDGLRVLVQAYVAWQVPDDGDHIRQFLRAVRNQPDEAADQLRSFVMSSLETTIGRFDMSALVNTDPEKVQINQLEQLLRQRLESQALNIYGITIRQVGIERLTLPNETLAATVARMRAERQTVAAQRVAEGQRAAAEIRSNADRDARITVANAQAEAAEIEAKARAQASEIYGRAYRGDPALYILLRSLDTLDNVVGDNTRLILRTDAAPFHVFVEGPGSAGGPRLPEPGTER
jgi:membrane protease subunit HflC